MSSKIESKNDWNDDEDDDVWDDWGDTEELPQVEEKSAKQQEQPSNNNVVGQDKIKTTTNITTVKDANSNHSNNAAKGQSAPTQQQQQGQQQQPKATSSWGIWGGISSVLSTATEGLGNITSTVSHGLNQVIGVPEPEEMARMNAEEAAAKAKETQHNVGKEKTLKPEEQDHNTDEQLTAPVFGLGLVTTLGSKVLNSGLDTLEGIGKKTMHILQENDPMLKNKRKMLGLEQDRPNLSETLQAARKDADQLESRLKELKIEKSKEQLRFDTLFEHNCGLVHLEALEILSKESALKLQSLLDSVSGNALSDMRETIDEVTELLDFSFADDCEDSEGDYDGGALNEQLLAAIEDADLQINFDEIVNTWTQAVNWIDTDAATADAQAVFARGITALAQTCALEMNKLHKIAELLLVKEHHSTANEVDAIVQLCKQFYVHLLGLTNRFAATLNRSAAVAEKNDSDDAPKKHIGTLFAELVVAQRQIDQAYKLFVPILQIGAV